MDSAQMIACVAFHLFISSTNCFCSSHRLTKQFVTMSLITFPSFSAARKSTAAVIKREAGLSAGLLAAADCGADRRGSAFQRKSKGFTPHRPSDSPVRWSSSVHNLRSRCTVDSRPITSPGASTALMLRNAPGDYRHYLRVLCHCSGGGLRV